MIVDPIAIGALHSHWWGEEVRVGRGGAAQRAAPRRDGFRQTWGAPRLGFRIALTLRGEVDSDR